MAPPPRIGICFICHGAIWENPVVMGCPTRHESHVGCLVALLLDPGAPCPPQCCRHLRLTAEMVRQLGREGVEAFLEKRERAARVYCSRPACRAWIPHPRVIYKLAICGLAECGALTCAQCRAPYHGEHSPCTSAMATTKEAVTCTSCGCKIERVAGWDEIGCRCGRVYCAKCGMDPSWCRCRAQGMVVPAILKSGEGQIAYPYPQIRLPTFVEPGAGAAPAGTALAPVLRTHPALCRHEWTSAGPEAHTCPRDPWPTHNDITLSCKYCGTSACSGCHSPMAEGQHS